MKPKLLSNTEALAALGIPVNQMLIVKATVDVPLEGPVEIKMTCYAAKGGGVNPDSPEPPEKTGSE